jgi:hypothetical protein
MDLDIYIENWIISDGNYRHFCEGETRDFALEFYAPKDLTKVALSSKHFRASSGYTYDVSAEIVFISEAICVLDFGLAAYSESSSTLKAGYQLGDFVQGRISLGIDPFFYFEQLSKISGVPPLIYEWRINSVEQDTSPLVPTEIGGRQGYRKLTGRSFHAVRATSENVTVPNEISPLHVLHCTKLDRPASSTFRHG